MTEKQRFFWFSVAGLSMIILGVIVLAYFYNPLAQTLLNDLIGGVQ